MVFKLARVVAMCCLLVLGASTAHSENIRSFDCEVRLHQDRTLDVTEVIVYNFGAETRHGILRFIPIKYERQQREYQLDLQLISISDEHDKARTYDVTEEGPNLQIKIGDAQTTVTGVQTYKIHYTVKRAVNFFGGEPEVYWNATGNEWAVAIDRATARFFPPSGVQGSVLQVAGFYGPDGADYKAFSTIENGVARFQVLNLEPQSGLTFAVRLPKGSVQPIPLQEVLSEFLRSWWPAIAVPLTALLFMCAQYFSRGRDDDGGQAVGVEWLPPKDLSPAEVGTLMNEKCELRDIISILFDLAVRGYIEIHEIDDKPSPSSPNDFAFVQILPEPQNDPLKAHEHIFLSGLFVNARVKKSNFKARKAVVENRLRAASTSTDAANEVPIEDLAARVKIVQLSELEGKFHPYIFSISHNIYQGLVARQIFVSNPEETRTGYCLMAIALVVLGVVVFPFAPTVWAGGLLGAGAIIFAFHKAMPAKTAKGSRYLQQCQSFARFVEMVEKPRLKQLYEEDPTIFEKLLPYAIVLGVADKWAAGFQDLLAAPPQGFYASENSQQQDFRTDHFVQELDRHVSTLSQTFSIEPNTNSRTSSRSSSTGSSNSSWKSSSAGSGRSGISGGGGHSGGGFGGGGGKSW